MSEKEKFWPFEKAREFVHSLDLRNQKMWFDYLKGKVQGKSERSKHVPYNPHLYYKDKGWVSWSDWLNTKNLKHNQKHFPPYEKAKKIIHKMNFKSKHDWDIFCQEKLRNESEYSDIISRRPNQYYRNKGWISWSDWLGTRIERFMPFKDAREIARSLKLNNCEEWRKFARGQMQEKGELQRDIPKTPDLVYNKDGWVNWGDWLGTGNICPKNKKFKQYDEAVKFVHKLNLKTITDWRSYSSGKMTKFEKRPVDIPSAPNVIYKNDGWMDWKHWLGTNKKKK